MSLARRAVQSSGYNLVSQAAQVIILFFRSVMLARILGPEVLGIYAFAQGIVAVTQPLANFGLGNAFVHRSSESEDADAPGVFLTLLTGFHLAWAVLLVAFSIQWLDEARRWVLWVLVGIAVFAQFTSPSNAILVRNIQFQRRAVIELATAVLTTVVSIFLALRGAELWALLSINIIDLALLWIGFIIVKPVWKIKFAWDKAIARYFLQYGGKAAAATGLVSALDRVDDLWTGVFLGDHSLGLYSRAYTFATYPRRILSTPIESVALSTYAEVKNDRRKLSQSFFRFTALAVRISLLASGSLFLIAPEFVSLLLGDEWLPMIGAFRWMVVYSMLDPIKYIMGNLFLSTGTPGVLVRIRVVQLIVLVMGLFTLGSAFGIVGVAIAATIMAVVGTLLILITARKRVDFSIPRLFGAPAASFALGVLASLMVISFLAPDIQPLVSILLKLGIFSLLYVSALFIIERQQIIGMVNLAQRVVMRKP